MTPAGGETSWLINPEDKQVYVYTPAGQVKLLENPSELSGEPVLSGFVLNLEEIWTTDF